MSLPDTSSELAVLRAPGIEVTQFSANTVALMVGSKLTVPAMMQIASGTELQIDGSFPAETTDAILQALLDGPGTTGAVLVLGGTSGAPTITPEIDTLELTGLTDGNFESLQVNGSTIFEWHYDASLDFANSVDETIGIADSPALSDVASYVAGHMNSSVVGNYGIRSMSAAGTVLTMSADDPNNWGDFSFSGSDVNFNNTQTGIDRVTALAALGNTVTTN